jgi:hypothetical protein
LLEQAKQGINTLVNWHKLNFDSVESLFAGQDSTACPEKLAARCKIQREY